MTLLEQAMTVLRQNFLQKGKPISLDKFLKMLFVSGLEKADPEASYEMRAGKSLVAAVGTVKKTKPQSPRLQQAILCHLVREDVARHLSLRSCEIDEGSRASVPR